MLVVSFLWQTTASLAHCFTASPSPQCCSCFQLGGGGGCCVSTSKEYLGVHLCSNPKAWAQTVVDLQHARCRHASTYILNPWARHYSGDPPGEGSLHLLVLRPGPPAGQQLHPQLEVLPRAAQGPTRRTPKRKNTPALKLTVASPLNSAELPLTYPSISLKITF